MSNNLGIDIENVVNVQLLKEQRGANYDNINHVIMMTSETGTALNKIKDKGARTDLAEQVGLSYEMVDAIAIPVKSGQPLKRKWRKAEH